MLYVYKYLLKCVLNIYIIQQIFCNLIKFFKIIYIFNHIFLKGHYIYNIRRVKDLQGIPG